MVRPTQPVTPTKTEGLGRALPVLQAAENTALRRPSVAPPASGFRLVSGMDGSTMDQLLPGSRPAQPAATGLTLSVTVAVLGSVLLAWLPLLLALGAAEEPGGWHEEAGIALGLVGLSLMLLQFAHFGRWHLVSGRSGIDVTMCFHRAAAILVLVMVLLHPVRYILPLLLDDPARGLARLHAMFTSPRMTAGKIAWIALVATVLLALGRRVIPYQYWRLLHGMGALIAAGRPVDLRAGPGAARASHAGRRGWAASVPSARGAWDGTGQWRGLGRLCALRRAGRWPRAPC